MECVRDGAATNGADRMNRNGDTGARGNFRCGGAAALLLVAFAQPAKPAAAPAAGDCDRDCLNQFVDQYLDALVAHDPSKLPVTKTVKFTEDGQRLELGDGFWRTANARGSSSSTWTIRWPVRSSFSGRCAKWMRR